MRLHRLDAQAFGPFAAPVTVDFDELSSAGLEFAHCRHAYASAFPNAPSIRISDDADEKFVADFVAAWTKVMQLDRFDLA